MSTQSQNQMAMENNRFLQRLAVRRDANDILDEKMMGLQSLLGIQDIAPVLGYGLELEKPLGILRTAAGAIKRNAAANIIDVETAVLDIFRDAYGNTTFFNKNHVLIEEKPMDRELIQQLLEYVLTSWEVEITDETFSKFTDEAVERVYQRAREEVAKQAKFEQPREENTSSTGMNLQAYE